MRPQPFGRRRQARRLVGATVLSRGTAAARGKTALTVGLTGIVAASLIVAGATSDQRGQRAAAATGSLSSTAVVSGQSAGSVALGASGSVNDVSAAPAQLAARFKAGLPFDMPSTQALRASSRKVFAHYMGSLPISIDNKVETQDYYTVQYLNPAGEGGVHKAYGGALRDRPIPRAPRSGDWRLEDMKREVAQATAAGIDGFALDILTMDSTDSVWQRGMNLIKAAESDPGFKIMLVPDMFALKSATPSTLASALNAHAKSPAVLRLDDGRLVVAPFDAEAHPVSWWSSFASIMQSTYGTRVALVPIFLNDQDNADAFAPISYGMGNWGSRNPDGNDYTSTGKAAPVVRAKQLQSQVGLWMQPVSVQDERPRKGIFEEARNTSTLRASWEVALRSGSKWVQLATWNDYSEGSHMEPSVKRGWNALDISAYYLTQMKTGSIPTIRRDAVYLSHRVQVHAAQPKYPQTKLMKLARGPQPVDTVEALTFMTAPGTVTVRSGTRSTTCDVPAGVSTCTLPLTPGTVSATVTRNGTATAAVTSPHTVTTQPYVQDLQYVAVSSLRDGSTVDRGPSKTPSATSAAPLGGARTVVSVQPASDVRVESGNPGRNFAGLSLASGGVSSKFQSFLRIAIPPTPAGKRVIKAELRVTTRNSAEAVSTMAQLLSLAEGNWQERVTTWSSRPTVSSVVVGRLQAAPNPNTTYAFWLNPTKVSHLAGKTKTFALTSFGSDVMWVSSVDATDPAARPTLVITYG